MSQHIAEADWKVFRQLRAIALERFCERILADIGRISADTTKSAHARYLAVFKLIRQRDNEIAIAFNDPRRSAAVRQLVSIQIHALLTDEEMAAFSTGIQETVQFLVELHRR